MPLEIRQSAAERVASRHAGKLRIELTAEWVFLTDEIHGSRSREMRHVQGDEDQSPIVLAVVNVFEEELRRANAVIQTDVPIDSVSIGHVQVVESSGPDFQIGECFAREFPHDFPDELPIALVHGLPDRRHVFIQVAAHLLRSVEEIFAPNQLTLDEVRVTWNEAERAFKMTDCRSRIATNSTSKRT